MKRLLVLLIIASCCVAPVFGNVPDSPTNFFTITLSTQVIQPGQTLTVFINSAHRLKRIELHILGRKLPMFHMWNEEYSHMFRAFAGIPAETRPGKYQVVANAVDTRGQALTIPAMLTVSKAQFKIQQINLSKKKTELLDYEQLAEEGNILARLFKQKDPRVYFSSPFVRPTKGRISSSFGLRRKYNGDEISSHHKGLDIANRTGTPVHAANGGKVSIAAKWKSHGNTILINHGHGIASVYIHLNEIVVKSGEWVKRGQLIGRIGSTGIATGPHLHFGISVNNVRVDPEQWIRNGIRLHY